MLKRKIAEEVVETIKNEVENLKSEYERLSKTAIQAASFWESQHDTTKQELSYEANRIQKRIAILEQSIKRVSTFIPTMLPCDQVEVGAFAKVQTSKGAISHFLILPFAEGEKVGTTMVLSPQSPIFREMHGKRAGELFSFGDATYTVLDVQ